MLLGVGQRLDARCDTFQYQPLISKTWKRILLLRYEPLHLEAWIMPPYEALAS